MISPLPLVAVPIVGASGTVAGMIELLVPEMLLVPTSLVAVTVNVYEVPFVRPVMMIGEEVPYAICPPLDVTVYVVIAEPPLLSDGVKLIVACPLPLVTVPIVGASGTVAGVTTLLTLEEALTPIALVAVTTKEYAVPFERPVMVIGEVPPVAVWPPLDVTV